MILARYPDPVNLMHRLTCPELTLPGTRQNNEGNVTRGCIHIVDYRLIHGSYANAALPCNMILPDNYPNHCTLMIVC